MMLTVTLPSHFRRSLRSRCRRSLFANDTVGRSLLMMVTLPSHCRRSLRSRCRRSLFANYTVGRSLLMITSVTLPSRCRRSLFSLPSVTLSSHFRRSLFADRTVGRSLLTIPLVALFADYIRVFAIYQILLGWKILRSMYFEVNIMKPTNSPTQGQPNPRKISLKVAFGPLRPTANIFTWVGIGFI